MGLFKRNTKRTSEAIEIKPVIAESPIVSVDELEQMVRVVFEEKLELERQLEAVKAELDHSKDTNAKLRAAEEFSRQVKRDASDIKHRLERAERHRDAREKAAREKAAREWTLSHRELELVASLTQRHLKEHNDTASR